MFRVIRWARFFWCEKSVQMPTFFLFLTPALRKCARGPLFAHFFFFNDNFFCIWVIFPPYSPFFSVSEQTLGKFVVFFSRCPPRAHFFFNFRLPTFLFLQKVGVFLSRPLSAHFFFLAHLPNNPNVPYVVLFSKYLPPNDF